jgi:hypothetical protein
MPRVRALRRDALLCAVTILGCRASGFESRGTGTQPREDTIRSAVIEIISDSTFGQVRVDPSPLPPLLDGVGRSAIPSDEDMRSSAGVGQLGSLWDVAVRAAPDSMRRFCAGILAPPGSESSHQGCPRDRLTIVVIGEPHAVAPGPLDSLRSTMGPRGAIRLVRAVNVLEASFTSHGRITTLWEYTLAATSQGWALLSRRAELVVE